MLEHQYIKGTEEVTLFEGVAEEGDIIQFEEPAYGLEASGFSVQSSGANYAVLSAGTGTLTGKKYVHMTRDVRVPVSEDEVSNVVEVKGGHPGLTDQLGGRGPAAGWILSVHRGAGP